jgi:signal peptidase I
MGFDSYGPDGPIPPTYKGDRIIVAKFPYEVGAPDRWDVAVFRYPLTAKTNFIKRIVGLPRETLQIFHGDILTRPEGGVDFKIQRKPPAKVQAMLQVVYDNDYPLPNEVAKGWPARWQMSGGTSEAGAWTSIADSKGFATDGKATEAWLRYAHFIPKPAIWDELRHGPLPAAVRAAIRPQLIGDFYGYDTDIHTHEGYTPTGQNWVGDLAIDCQLEALGSDGQVIFELVESGRSFQCRIDLKSGLATLSAEDAVGFGPQAHTPVHGPGTYHLQFANVDDQLLLWVDGKLMAFDGPTAYDLAWRPPTRRDFSPVGIATRHAQVQVKHLRVLRDIYYIADKNVGTSNSSITFEREWNDRELPDFDTVVNHGVFPTLRPVEFTLEADQFLALGDNSPKSKDSRLWSKDPNNESGRHFVQRDLLVGKALFIYWPHALDHIPGTSIWFPLFPNFGRMRFIR